MLKELIPFVFLIATLVACETKQNKVASERGFSVDTTKKDESKLWNADATKRLREAFIFIPGARDFVILQTSFKEIPDSVFLLLNLRKLQVMHNQNLSVVSPDICNLKELEVLKLSANKISELSIGCLSRLKRLELRNNDFKLLPEGLHQLLELTYLGFQNNKLTNGLQNKLPPNLVELYIYNCNLKEFPTELLELKNVEKINLSANPISDIPLELSRLKTLKELDIKETSIPRKRVEQLEELMPWCEFIVD